VLVLALPPQIDGAVPKEESLYGCSFALRWERPIVMNLLDAVIPAGIEAPRKARRLLQDVLPQLPAAQADDVKLMVNELVTNSVKHASVAPGAPIRVHIEIEGDALRGEVSDQGVGFRIRPMARERTGESGYGLRLVQEMADRWGLNVRDGTCVWFEIDLAVA
jgi:anti-sigma regulatory factor (Ser/Thr protein kinase)